MKVFAYILMVLFCQASYAGKILSESEFVERYVNAVKDKVDGVKVVVAGNLEVKFESGDGDERVSFLDNAYLTYKNNPESLEDILEQYSGSLKEMFQPVEASFGKERIFPVIKDSEYIRQVEAMVKEKGSKDNFPFYYERLNKELFVLYVFDTETSMQFISQDDIDKLGIKNKELRHLAKNNLWDSVQLQLQGNPGAVSMLVADGTYEASFILYDGIWSKEQFPVKGDIVVYIPTRDLVLITGSEDAEGLKQVRSIVYDPKNEWPHMVSDKGFVRKGNDWEVLNM